MINYTYNDFEKALNKSGLAGTFSQADMQLAKSNPNAGMSILNYKKDYTKATTDEGRYLANVGAENVRKKYGSYTGGTDGSGYYFTEDSPSSFIPSSKAPEYKSEYSDDITSLYEKQKNYGDFVYDADKPVYQNRYGDKIDELISDIENTKEFSYNPAKDPLYGTYRKQYLREGKRATEDTMGSAAAMTGGIPSSFAVAAAAQAGNYYKGQLADKMPELYELAYNQHMNELNNKLSELNIYRNAEETDYARYLNELNAFNNEKAEAFDRWQRGYETIGNNLSAATALENKDFAKYLDLLSKHNADRNFEYGKYLDDINFKNDEKNNELELAILAAENGDYSRLRALGINVSDTVPTQPVNTPIVAGGDDEGGGIDIDDLLFGDEGKGENEGDGIVASGNEGTRSLEENRNSFPGLTSPSANYIINTVLKAGGDKLNTIYGMYKNGDIANEDRLAEVLSLFGYTDYLV